VSEANRQDNVTASTTPSPTRPFTAPTAGADYFATEPHYVFFEQQIKAALIEQTGDSRSGVMAVEPHVLSDRAR